MSPCRLLVIISGLSLGGTERNLVYLLSRLDRSRFDVRVWSLEGGGTQEPLVADMGIPVEVLKLPKINSLHALGRVPELIRRMKDIAPDCICCFSFDAELVGVPLGVLTGCRAVCTVRRDMGDWGRTGRQHRVRRLLNPFVHRIIANCRAVGDAAARREGFAAKKLDVIANGIPAAEKPSEAAVREYRDQFDSPVVTMVGNYRNAVKGHEYLIRALALLYGRGYRFTCVIAGSGYPGSVLADTLHRLAVTGMPAGVVRFAGQVQNVPALLGVSDICVNPSLSEGMSNAILEYMAAGRPVVATTVGGTPEVVEDGVTGLLVPPGDDAALAGALGRLLDDGDARETMGAAGRKRIADGFTAERMAGEYARLFEVMAAEGAV